MTVVFLMISLKLSDLSFSMENLGSKGLFTAIIVALVSLSDHLAMRGPQPLTEHWSRHLATVRLLLTRYIRERERILPPRLIQANELMQRITGEPVGTRAWIEYVQGKFSAIYGL